jgi:hypothetical protein
MCWQPLPLFPEPQILFTQADQSPTPNVYNNYVDDGYDPGLNQEHSPFVRLWTAEHAKGCSGIFRQGAFHVGERRGLASKSKSWSGTFRRTFHAL